MITNRISMIRQLLRDRGPRDTARIIGSRLVGGDYGRVKKNARPAQINRNYFENHSRWLSHAITVDSDTTPATELFRANTVAVVADLNLPQCKKYRVMQKLEALSSAGIKCTYSHWEDIPRSLNHMQLANTVIFYRVPLNPKSEQYFQEARRLGVKVGYDIDDPIFDSGVYSINHNLSFLEEHERRGLLSQCSNYSAALRRCDFLFVSTPGMSDLAKRHFDGQVLVWRNMVDTESGTIAKRIARTSSDVSEQNSKVVIGYMSGSRAHEADFRTASAVLADIMAKHENTALHIVGHLNLPDEFQKFADRIVEKPFTTYEDYLQLLNNVDINIIPLKLDAFNECKSAIRYLEASILSVPSVVSRVGDFKSVVKDETVGLLVEGDEQWRSALEGLITDHKKRQSLGKAARKHVFDNYTLSALPPNLYSAVSLPTAA